jgi:ATP/maltotriose-dependent transcriptional regulator MalT
MPKFHTCTTCKTRNGCRSLCDKAQAYADQDKVNLRELTVPIPVLMDIRRKRLGHYTLWDRVQDAMEIGDQRESPTASYLRDGVTLTNREVQILTLAKINGYGRKQIAKSLRISTGCLRIHLLNLRRKIYPTKQTS